MKNKNLLKGILISAAVLAVMTTPVFANKDLQKDSSTEEAIEILYKENYAKFVLHSGIVEIVENYDDGSVRVQISNDNMGLIAVMDKSTVVLQGGQYKSIEDIKKGMEITFIIPSNAPMGLSMPPYTGSVAVAVIHDENTFFDVSKYDEELLSESSKLKLNIDENTSITDIKGTKKIFTKDDVKNTESIVFYTTSTRSIPAQTTPSMIMILDKYEEAEYDVLPIEYIPLREMAEKNGYEVIWTSNDDPVAVKNGVNEITVEIGKNEIYVNGEERRLEFETRLEGGTIEVSSEILNILENEKD